MTAKAEIRTTPMDITHLTPRGGVLVTPLRLPYGTALSLRVTVGTQTFNARALVEERHTDGVSFAFMGLGLDELRALEGAA